MRFLSQSILFSTRSALLQVMGDRALKIRSMITLSVLSALLDVFGMAAMVYLVNYLTTEQIVFTSMGLIVLVASLVVFFMVKNLLVIWLTKQQAQFAFREAQRQGDSVFKTVYAQDELFFADAETGSLISDMMYVPSSFANGVLLGYIILVTELLVCALMVAFMLLVAFQITLFVVLCIAPAAWLGYRAIRGKLSQLGNHRNTMVKRGQDILVQSIRAHTDAVIYDAEGYFRTGFNKAQEQISATDATVFTLNNIPTRLLELFAVVALGMIWFYCAVIDPTISLVFVITVFAASAFRLLPSVNRSLGAMLRIRNNWFAIETLLRYNAEQKQKEGQSSVTFKKEILVENLTFRYPQGKAIQFTSISIPHGHCMGIFGQTGEGKSTFIKLLLQLIPSDQGLIKVDGETVVPDNRSSFRHLFSYVPQDVFILNGSLIENITLSSHQPERKDRLEFLMKELRLQDIAHVFSASVQAGEAGSRLSGGQKKLIALARALYADRAILVIDEVTASLDDATAQNVLALLKEENKRGTTIIIISHQKATFEICDKVYALDSGNFSVKNVQPV